MERTLTDLWETDVLGLFVECFIPAAFWSQVFCREPSIILEWVYLLLTFHVTLWGWDNYVKRTGCDGAGSWGIAHKSAALLEECFVLPHWLQKLMVFKRRERFLVLLFFLQVLIHPLWFFKPKWWSGEVFARCIPGWCSLTSGAAAGAELTLQVTGRWNKKLLLELDHSGVENWWKVWSNFGSSWWTKYD